MSDTSAKCDPLWHDGAKVPATFMMFLATLPTGHEVQRHYLTGESYAACAAHKRRAEAVLWKHADRRLRFMVDGAGGRPTFIVITRRERTP